VFVVVGMEVPANGRLVLGVDKDGEAGRGVVRGGRRS